MPLPLAAAILERTVQSSGQQPNSSTLIVDLMKALRLDSSIIPRKKPAHELG